MASFASKSVLILAAMNLTACTTWTPEQREQFARTMNAQAQQYQQQAQQDQAAAENDIRSIGSHPIKTAPMKGSNGYSDANNEKNKSPKLPLSFGGYRTGRIKFAPDGKAYYEMKDASGTVYWTDAPPQ